MNIFLITVILTYHITCCESRRRWSVGRSDFNAIEPVEMTASLTSETKVLKDQAVYDYDSKNRYFYFAGDDGILQIIDTEEEVDKTFLRTYIKEPGNHYYFLYTRANPVIPQILTYGDSSYIVNSNFDSAKNTIIISHGWRGNFKINMNIVLTKAFLEDADVNVIVFDWNKLSHKLYVTAKASVTEVGRSLGKFINWLATNGFTMYHKIHLVGHNLGAHVVGNAGRETGGAVARITGLDPAGPLWYFDPNRLTSTDALYVEVIHTNSRIMGYAHTCGDADFYPNGGMDMPGCWTVNPSCSHGRAYEYMASSIVNNSFEAKKCMDYNDMRKDKCNGTTNLMGNSDLYKAGRGIFRLNTEASYPYIGNDN